MIRFPVIGLLLPAVLLSPAAAFAAENSLLLADDDPEYYLLQAFHTNEAGERAGFLHLGLLAEFTEQGYVVSATLNGFPAQQAGLRRGDQLLNVEGRPFHPVQSLNPQIGDTRAGIGEMHTVTLEYRRNGSVQQVEVSPVYGNLFDAYRSATLASVQQFSNGNKLIGYLKLWSFDRSADGLQAYRQLVDSLAHCDGLIIDLRDSYGFINAEHLDRFFSSRNGYFTVQGQAADLWQERQSRRENRPYYSRAMVIIQNQGTSGGAELFAYQLARQPRVISLGERTAGKAGQVTFKDDRSLYYRPAPAVTVDGMEMENHGFPPERTVPYPLTESLPSDPQFDAAMRALMEII